MKKLSAIAASKVRSLIWVSYENPEVYKIKTEKLSDYYSSRSTSYAKCLNEYPFVIIRDKAKIVEAGFSPLCKAVITLDQSAPEVQEIISEMVAERIREKENDILRKQKHELKVHNTIAEFDKVKDKLAAKWFEKTGSYAISHKEANQFAWKKQNYITGGADIVLYRGLIKDYFRQLESEKAGKETI